MRVGFVFFNAHVSLIWVLLIAALLGALVDRLVIILGQRRRRSISEGLSRGSSPAVGVE